MNYCVECGAERTGKSRGAKERCDKCYQRWRRATHPDIYQARDKARWTNRRDVQNERRKEYYETHKDKHAENARVYRDTHREEIRAQQRDYYRRFKEQRLARDKVYKFRRRDHFRVLARIRSRRYVETQPRDRLRAIWRRNTQTRNTRKAAAAANLTHSEWGCILEGFNNCCVYCNSHVPNLTQDHIIPIAKGGSYTADNIVPACLSCNSRKRTRDYVEFLRNR